MRKTIYKVLIMSLVLLTYSCQKEETKELVSKKEAQGLTSQQYQADAKVLQEFVRIDKVNNRYYLDLETKDQQTATISKKVVEQFQQISAAHKKKFVDGLEELNTFIREQTKNQADYVVMETSRDSYTQELSDSLNLTPIKEVDEHTGSGYYISLGSINFTRQDQYSKPFETYGKDKVITMVAVNSSNRTNNVAAVLTCDTGTSIQNGRTTTKVVVTSPKSTISQTFNWKNNQTGERVYWKFRGLKKSRPDINAIALVYNGQIDPNDPTTIPAP
ncbi:hypothetical protein ACPDHL_03750 [Myroides sp. C15-4]|uniref:hypothetical protein n=1 Tax=Myroides sp. C15-4 TaxID=3400532 RepID=UPI003D2F9657